MKIEDFEFEFCLKRDAYCKFYQEDGSLWDLKHQDAIKCMHEVFKQEKEFRIMEDINAIIGVFATKEEMLNALDKPEFDEEEFKYIINCINSNNIEELYK